MEKRVLGNRDLEISAIGLGCMGMSHGYGIAPDENEMIRVIHHAIEKGIDFFDTAGVILPASCRYYCADTKPWIVPIPGTRKAQRIDENIGSIDI